MHNEIVLHIQDQIATLTVNRPQRRNALNWQAQEQFATAVTAVGQNPAVHALIITGSGRAAFVSGGDLKELSQHTAPEDGARLNRIMSAALHQLTALPIPVIAAINGDAFGGGCEILTACDLRIAASHARFSFAQVKNAVTSGWGGTARLVPLIGQSRAMELLLTARPFSASAAQEMGFVHRVVPPETAVLSAAHDWAAELLTLPHNALAAIKQLVHAAATQPQTAVQQLETQLFTQLWPHPNHLEALAAFAEKRPPRFNQQTD